MQAHSNVIAIGISAAVILGPAGLANAQSDTPAAPESALMEASKPPSQKPHRWIADASHQATVSSPASATAPPDAISTVYRISDRPLIDLNLAQALDVPADEPIEAGEPGLPSEASPEATPDPTESTPLLNDNPDDSGVEDEIDAAEEADLESVEEFLDEDSSGDVEIPDDTESLSNPSRNPLSQPLELDDPESLDAGGDRSTEAEAADGAPGEEDEPLEDELGDDAPSQTVQNVLEILRAPANPLFFPTDPETLEVTENVPITLQEALQVAYRNSRELQTAQLQFEQAQAALREAQAQRLPTLNTSASYSRSTLNTFNDGASSVVAGTVSAGGNFTDTDSDLSGTVSLDYDLFTAGSRRASIRAAREARRLQELQIEVAAEDIQLNVTEAYYDIQEADETVRINRDNLDEAIISFRDAAARERAGVGTRFDRLQAQVEVANARQDLRNSISNQLITQRQLVELLSLPPAVNLTAADPVDIAGQWQLSLSESLTLAYKNRAELEQQVVQSEIDRQQRRVARASSLPQVSLSAQYDIADNLDKTRTESSDDLDQFTISAQVSWLLFDGGASRAAARQESLDIEIAETTFADTRESIRFEVEQAFFGLESNLENITTAQAAVRLAEESLRLARLRFQAGVGIQSDVIQAQTDLTEAEANLVTAVLGYNRALVSIQRAVSNLPDNNLADIPPGNL